MKTVIFLLLFLATFASNAQNKKLKGVIINCQMQDELTYGMLKLWKGKTLISDKIKCSDGDFEIDNLVAGTYIIEFENIFRQTLKKTITIKDSLTELKLCNDEFVDIQLSTIFDELKENDTISLDFSSSGCFHSFQEKSIFYKKGNKIFGQLYKENGQVVKKKINSEKLAYLILFEKKARIIDVANGFCTTANIYKFSLNNKVKFSCIDTTCDWSGYSPMTKTIFGQNE